MIPKALDLMEDEMAILGKKDIPRRLELIRRLIADASDEVVEQIYRRILVNKLTAVERRRPEISTAKSWEQIIEQAVNEGIFTQEEGALLLDDPVFGEEAA